jgi:hypothetical protein
MSDAPTKGHVKVSRKVFETDPWWNEPRERTRFEAWLDVIQLAAFRAGRFATEYGPIELARGEFVASLRWLAARWHWTVKRVRNWLATAEKWARLRAQRETAAGTVYLIVNYDRYQSQGHSEGTEADTEKGTAGAQRGHKIEAVKAVKHKSITSASADEQRVLDHYRARHPKRRVTSKSVGIVRRALGFGYSSDELCAAVDGNADDLWHVERQKHELSYVLRDEEHIDGFCDKASTGRRSVVDPATGLLNVAGMALVAGGRR